MISIVNTQTKLWTILGKVVVILTPTLWHVNIHMHGTKHSLTDTPSPVASHDIESHPD